MLKILKMLKPYRGSLALSIIFSAIYAILEILIPIFTKYILSEGIIMKDMNNIIYYGVIMLLLTLAGGIVSVLNTFFSTKTTVNYAMGLRNTVFEKVSHLSQSDVDRIGVSSMMTRTTNDIRQVHEVILNSLKSILPVPIMLIGGFYMAYSTNQKLLRLIFIVIPIILVILLFLLIFIMPMFSKVQKLVDKLNFILRGKIGGIRVIRAFNKSDYEDDKFDESNKKLTKLSLRAHRILSSLLPILTVALYSLICYIIYMSVTDVMEPGLTQKQMLETIPNMYMFITYFALIIGALGSIVAIVVTFPRAVVSAKRINEILDAVPDIKESEKPAKPDENLRGVVEFRNVSFRYKPVDDKKKKSKFAEWLSSDSKKDKKKKDEEPLQTIDNTEPETVKIDADAVSDVNFISRPGEVTAIIGITGSGKSSLVNLIPRLYDVTEGQLIIDGVDVRDMSFDDLHSRIAYVPQQSYLFSGTVKDNIKFGNPDATDDEVWHAIEIAQAKAFVSSMADGIDSFVSQAGKNYSGGQKQRLAIARAIVKNADVYIFDDSFSALDLATDARLRASLRENLPDANIFIVAQRVGTVINADRIIVLDNGKVVGMGVHEELLENCEVYKSIVASQLSDGEEEAAV